MAKYRVSRNTTARDRIRQFILSAHAAGDLISENELIERLKLTRTPVREALSALEAEGLVEIIPKRGTRIRKPAIEEIQAILDLRQLVEAHVALKLAARIAGRPQWKPQVEEQIASILQEQHALADNDEPVNLEENERFWQTDVEFHAAICTLAGYAPAAEILRKFYFQVRLVAVSALRNRDQLRDVVREHRTIWKSITSSTPKKQEDAIRRSIAEHLENAKRRWFEQPFF